MLTSSTSTVDTPPPTISTHIPTNTTCQHEPQATSTAVIAQATARLVALATTVGTSGFVSLDLSVLPQPLLRLAITAYEEQCAVATTITTTPEATTMPATPAAHTCKQEAAALAAPAPLLLAPSPSEARQADFLTALQELYTTSTSSTISTTSTTSSSSSSSSTSSTSTSTSAAAAAAACTTEAVITLPPAAQPCNKAGKAGRRSLADSITATLCKWDEQLAAANRRLQQKLEAASSKRAAGREVRKASEAAKAARASEAAKAARASEAAKAARASEAAKAAVVVVAKQGPSSGRLLVSKVLRRFTSEARAVAQIA